MRFIPVSHHSPDSRNSGNKAPVIASAADSTMIQLFGCPWWSTRLLACSHTDLSINFTASYGKKPVGHSIPLIQNHSLNLQATVKVSHVGPAPPFESTGAGHSRIQLVTIEETLSISAISLVRAYSRIRVLKK